MFIYIPLALIALSLTIVAVVVARKWTYLRRLEPDAHETGSTILHDFAPELVDRLYAIPWRQYVRDMLVELERILRATRQFVSSIDRASDTVIRKVRRVHQQTSRKHEEVVAQREAQQVADDEEADERPDFSDPEQLKAEEQRLIVAIAQDPKDAQLYRDLARVYLGLANHADAVEALKAALKLEPTDERTAKRLEKARRRLERVQAEEKGAEQSV